MTHADQPRRIPLVGTTMHQHPLSVRLLGTFALVLLAGWGSASRVAARELHQIPAGIDAPFRDGVFQGRLAAGYCRPQQAPVGRWSDRNERRRFAAGYDTAYALATESGDACPARRDPAMASR